MGDKSPKSKQKANKQKSSKPAPVATPAATIPTGKSPKAAQPVK